MDRTSTPTRRRLPGRAPREPERGWRALAYLLVVLAVVLGLTQRAQAQPALRDALRGVVDTLSGDESDAEVAASDEADQFVRVGKNERVTLHLAGAPLAKAVQMLSEATRRNIILAGDVGGTVNASIYEATFEAALEAILVSNRLGYRLQGDFIFVYPLEEIAKMQDAERRIETRVIRLSYMNAKAAQEIIEGSLLSKIGRIAVTPNIEKGLGSQGPQEVNKGDEVATGDTLVITDYVEVLDQIEGVLRELDVRPKQVLIESTILRATLNEDNVLGIDFTTVGGIDFEAVQSTSPAAQDIVTGNIPENMLGDTNFTVRTDFNQNVPAGGFTFGIIKDQVGFFIRALEDITDTQIIANPKVLALNKQFGEVIVGRRDGYLTTTITETTAIQTVEFLETGTVLTFRPFIGDDGYVRMEIHPKDSTGGLTQANLPFEQTTEVTTNIMVRDGHTILIGGLFREVSTAARGQVPGLGDIPIAGALFRSTEDVTVREEVIILLTVHIVEDEVDTRASEELNEDVERFRVGMRQGLQWHGRERLAQAHYRWALEHMERGDLDRALWDARLAVHNYPRHIHAIGLLEKLQGERAWEDEASAIRTFVRDRIAEQRNDRTPLTSPGEVKGRPPFGRPTPPFVLPGEFEGDAASGEPGRDEPRFDETETSADE